MHRSLFISAGELGQPLDDSTIVRAANLIQGDSNTFRWPVG